MEGATNVGAIGYADSPESAEAALGASASAKYAGLKSTYTNADFPFGSVNVAARRLGHEASRHRRHGRRRGAGRRARARDGAPPGGGRPEGRQRSQPVTAADLQQGGPAALFEAQNVYFFGAFEPMEMDTPATELFQKYLTQAGVTGDPTYAEYVGYASVAMLVQALKITGNSPSQAKLISALYSIKSFNAAGLLGFPPWT